MNESLNDIALVFPTANVLELKNGYRIDIPVPGYSKHEFRVSLTNRVINLSARRIDDVNKIDFFRSIKLPEYMDMGSEITTFKYHEGIISIKLVSDKTRIVK
ncbi:MAG: hypothetical protein ACK4ND_10120 [Cytophagaceae bacterium]